MNKKLRKLFSLFLSILMMSTVVPTDFTRPVKAEAATTSAADYGLLDKACDGLILHCWNWSYSNIKDSMADIAAAGYTSLQTSPVQMPKDAGSGDTQSTWWKVYQPTTLSMVDHPWFGTKAEFKAMCDEAEKYGIKVIVDIVANHMANNSGSRGNCKDDICGQNDPTFRDDETCWHLNGSTYIDYNNQHRNGDASSLTHGFGGWPDLNTGNPKVQNAIISLLKECVDLGADGFRFDAAKYVYYGETASNVDFWNWYMGELKKIKPDIYCVAEVWDSDSLTQEYAAAVNCFDFTMSQADGMIATTAKLGDVNTYNSYVEKYLAVVKAKNASNTIIPFIANHDTDRAAGYMTLASGYAKTAANLYILGPGSPFIYYGEEIELLGVPPRSPPQNMPYTDPFPGSPKTSSVR